MKRIVLLMMVAAVVMSSCGGVKNSALKWSTDSIVINKDSNDIRMLFPVAEGGALADSVNTAVATLLKAGFVAQPNNYTVAQALDTLIAQKNSTEEIAHLAYQIMSEGSICQHGEVTSLFVQEYAFLGGAHGMTMGNYRNFDSKTGAKLKMDQMFTDTVKLKELNREAFGKFLTAKGGEDVSMYLFVKQDELPLPQNIGLDSTGVVMLYNQYEIAAYVFGQSRYVLPYAEVESILSDIAK